MTVGPRVVFTRFVSAVSPKLAPWREHALRVMGHEPDFVTASATRDAPADVAAGRSVEGAHRSQSAADSPAPAVVWHLISANNRMLARSAQIFNSVHDAVEDAEQVISSVSRLEISNVGDESRGMHGWMAFERDSTAMICARWYLTDRDRRHAIDLALTSIGSAMIRPGARTIERVVHPSIREPM